MPITQINPLLFVYEISFKNVKLLNLKNQYYGVITRKHNNIQINATREYDHGNGIHVHVFHPQSAFVHPYLTHFIRVSTRVRTSVSVSECEYGCVCLCHLLRLRPVVCIFLHCRIKRILFHPQNALFHPYLTHFQESSEALNSIFFTPPVTNNTHCRFALTWT